MTENKIINGVFVKGEDKPAFKAPVITEVRVRQFFKGTDPEQTGVEVLPCGVFYLKDGMSDEKLQTVAASITDAVRAEVPFAIEPMTRDDVATHLVQEITIGSSVGTMGKAALGSLAQLDRAEKEQAAAEPAAPAKLDS